MTVEVHLTGLSREEALETVKEAWDSLDPGDAMDVHGLSMAYTGPGGGLLRPGTVTEALKWLVDVLHQEHWRFAGGGWNYDRNLPVWGSDPVESVEIRYDWCRVVKGAQDGPKQVAGATGPRDPPEGERGRASAGGGGPGGQGGVPGPEGAGGREAGG